MFFRVLVVVATLPLMIAAPRLAESKDLSLEAEAGLGYDSNAYLAPNRSYTDPFLDMRVVPRRRSGFFLPMGIDLRQEADLRRIEWHNRLQFEGRHYLDSALDNADTYRTEVSTGLGLRLRKEGRKTDTLYIGPSLAYNRQIYFDRDTGLERTTSTSLQNLSDRYKYWRYGLESELELDTLGIPLRIRAQIAKYDYSEVPAISSLDHLYYRLGGKAYIPLAESSRLDLGFDYSTRHYEDRAPRDLDGDLADEAPDRRYLYWRYSASLRQELAADLVLYLDYDLLSLEDDFVGYNDYDRDRYRARIYYRPDGYYLRASLAYWERDYPRAFIFDNADGSRTPKHYATWDALLRLEKELVGNWKLWGEMNLKDQDSSDPRYDYRRHELMVGLQIDL